jgi:hypothetical protein
MMQMKRSLSGNLALMCILCWVLAISACAKAITKEATYSGPIKLLWDSNLVLDDYEYKEMDQRWQFERKTRIASVVHGGEFDWVWSVKHDDDQRFLILEDELPYNIEWRPLGMKEEDRDKPYFESVVRTDIQLPEISMDNLNRMILKADWIGRDKVIDDPAVIQEILDLYWSDPEDYYKLYPENWWPTDSGIKKTGYIVLEIKGLEGIQYFIRIHQLLNDMVEVQVADLEATAKHRNAGPLSDHAKSVLGFD